MSVLKHLAYAASGALISTFAAVSIHQQIAGKTDGIENKQTDRAPLYTKTLQEIIAEDKRLARTTDEAAAERLQQKKKDFVTEVLFYKEIRENDFNKIAGEFNKVFAEDTDMFKARATYPQSYKALRECQISTPWTGYRHTYAAKIDTCMTAWGKENQNQMGKFGFIGLSLGGVAGLGASLIRRKTPAA